MGDISLGMKLLGMGTGSMPVGARIAGVDDAGRASVIFLGAEAPVPARCTVAPSGIPPRGEIDGAEVLIVFEDGDARRPVIIGFVRDMLWGPQAPAEVHTKVLIEGEEEVVIRCGKSSLSMSADGRVVIKGTRVTSRATEANKVRGAVVLIN
jgi:hypothetical protein